MNEYNKAVQDANNGVRRDYRVDGVCTVYKSCSELDICTWANTTEESYCTHVTGHSPVRCGRKDEP